jgi:hypothetical protein
MNREALATPDIGKNPVVESSAAGPEWPPKGKIALNRLCLCAFKVVVTSQFAIQPFP